MLSTRVIPALLLCDGALVKTVKFHNPDYIGDPINTVRIFNELEVDELIFLDITATKEKKKPNLKLLAEIANECFMPLGYGGGLNDFDTVKEIFHIGFEKVILNSVAYQNPEFISRVAEHYGNQAVVLSVDVKKNLWGSYEVWTCSGTVNTKKNPVEWCQRLEKFGVGEILLTSIDCEGTWSGYDLNLIKKVADSVSVPVVANGGAGNVKHIQDVVKQGHASAAGLGSMVVYQQKGMGVLINFPDSQKLAAALQ